MFINKENSHYHKSISQSFFVFKSIWYSKILHFLSIGYYYDNTGQLRTFNASCTFKNPIVHNQLES